MKKLKLQLDNLKVETFETSDAREERRGTVDANMAKPRPPLIETYYAGDTCECTLAQSCIHTNCFMECIQDTDLCA